MNEQQTQTEDALAAWLVDAVAAASQHPALNEASPEYDQVLAAALFDNGKALAASGVPTAIRELPARWNDEGLSVDGATSEFNHGYKAAKYEDADALAKAIASTERGQ